MQYIIYLWHTDTIYHLLQTHHITSHKPIPGLKNSYLTPSPWSDPLWHILFENVKATTTHREHVQNGLRVAGIYDGLIPYLVICCLRFKISLISLIPFSCNPQCLILHSKYILTAFSLTFRVLNLSPTLTFQSWDKASLIPEVYSSLLCVRKYVTFPAQDFTRSRDLSRRTIVLKWVIWSFRGFSHNCVVSYQVCCSFRCLGQSEVVS